MARMEMPCLDLVFGLLNEALSIGHQVAPFTGPTDPVNYFLTGLAQSLEQKAEI